MDAENGGRQTALLNISTDMQKQLRFIVILVVLFSAVSASAQQLSRADALPDISWNTTAMRSRDPGLLNSPNFDNFPPEFRTALSPIPANAFATTADFRQTLFSFKLGKALEAARLARTAGEQELQRARQATTLDAVRSYNQLLFTLEQLRVVRDSVASKQSHLDFAQNRRAAGAATELEVLR